MKLDDVQGRQIEVRKGGAGKAGAGVGIGGIIALVIGLLLSGGGGGGGGGIDPNVILGQLQGGGASGEGEKVDPSTLGGNEEFAGKLLTLLDAYWQPQAKRMDFDFAKPNFVVFDSPTNTGGCGVGTPQAGPFYCPGDQKIYVDFGFYEQLEKQLGFEGDFAMAYVIAHEYGHHIQRLEGTLGGGSRDNAQSVRIELQADCYAGAWASSVDDRLEPGDFDEAIDAAEAVGDDAIQGDGANRDSFTHGSSAERKQWFKQGFDSGDPKTCQTGA